jgi:hypothetical protein
VTLLERMMGFETRHSDTLVGLSHSLMFRIWCLHKPKVELPVTAFSLACQLSTSKNAWG